MKVTNKMIHKDIRLIGSILRKFTSGMTEERFRKAYENELKKVDKARPKKAVMEKINLRRSDDTDMRVMILRPDKERQQL